MKFFALFLSLFLFAAFAFADTLVVLNKAEATASLVDLATGKIAGTISTGNGPHEGAATRDGKYVLVTNYGTREAPGNSLTLIDVAAARSAGTIELGEYKRPHGVQWFPDGKRALVTCEENKALIIVDVPAKKVEKAIVTDQEISHMVALAPDSKRAYVASIGSGTVTAIDLIKMEKIKVIPTGKGAEGIDITPDARWIWVTNREADTVSVIDAISLEVVKTLDSKSFPIRAKVTPDGKQVLVSNAKTGDIAVFDAAAKTELRRITIPQEAVATEGRVFGGQFGNSSVPVGILINPEGTKAYVAHTNADVISIIDLKSWKLEGKLTAGKEPDGMAYSKLSIAVK